ncbi:hypothetical protein ACHAXH_006983 [Discostella pseudostelligera]
MGEISCLKNFRLYAKVVNNMSMLGMTEQFHIGESLELACQSTLQRMILGHDVLNRGRNNPLCRLG